MVEPLSPALLESIAKILGEVMSGSDMSRLLQRAALPDVSQQSTKWRRLLDNFEAVQRRDGAGNAVVRFIKEAMDPARFLGRKGVFDGARHELNEALHLAGLTMEEDASITRVKAATTLSAVEERSRRLKNTLLTRDVHPDVLKCCKVELLDDNYFHAVLEATKSLAEKIRTRTGLSSDGARLVDDAFGRGSGLPKLAFNTLQTPSEQSEHVGLMNLMKGVFSAFRNPTAHEAKANWPVSEQDAFEILALVSMLHRRIDKAVLTA